MGERVEIKTTKTENHTFHVDECGLKQHLKLNTHSHEIFGFILLPKRFLYVLPDSGFNTRSIRICW